MDARPELKVRVAINVARRWGDERAAKVLIAEFVERFPTHVWPGARLPELYFHPEGPEPFDGAERACLHAKCVVVDGKTALITSANFSDAAHERNVELGVRIDDPAVALAIEDEIDRLIAASVLVPLA
jgi:phosphatidylserine/phosphatidylglycerophosphate/cardiolipin synthase-like enzyme